MVALFGLAGMILMGIGLILLIIRLVQKKPKKKPALLIALGVALYIVAIILVWPETKKATTETSAQNSIANEDIPEETAVEEKITDAPEAPKPTATVDAAKNTPSAEESNKNKVSYILDANDPADGISDYMTFNEGTEFEDRALIFRIESGTYEVSNIGSYMSQVSVYKDGEKNTTEEGWEEWVTGDGGGAYSIDVGETIEISIPDGYIIHLDAPAKLNLTQK